MDGQARPGRDSRSTRRMPVRFLAVGLVMSASLVGASSMLIRWATTSSASIAHEAVSVMSTHAPLSATSRQLLNRIQRETGHSVGPPSLIATNGGRAYYRIPAGDGAYCYGVGDVSVTTVDIGEVQCAPDFPSAKQPILDFTVMHGQGHVWRSEGFASDGIADVAFVDQKGHLLSVTSTAHNIYHVLSPPSGTVKSLVAHDPTGHVVWSESFER
jgi:hypothetical protein